MAYSINAFSSAGNSRDYVRSTLWSGKMRYIRYCIVVLCFQHASLRQLQMHNPWSELQRRRLGTNICLITTPFLFCMLLWGFQHIINRQLDSNSFKCGCKCTSCCDWFAIPGMVCGNALCHRCCLNFVSCRLNLQFTQAQH